MLNGIRVIEWASYVAAPGACAILADWGAEVIKVEPPAGDPFRRFFAAVGRDDPGENRVFENDNRGKRSIALDLRAEEDAATLRALLATADVFVTNVRPASLARLGIDADQLRAANPRLIFAGFTGYGATGPDADEPGFDITAFWARSGLATLATVKGEAPVPLRTGIGDHTAALGLVAGIMAALYHRERTGEGQRLDGSLLRTGVYAASSEHAIQLQLGKLASTRARHAAVNPLGNAFRTADDRWFMLVPRTNIDDWPSVARALEREDLLADARFATVRSRREHVAEMVTLLDEGFAALTWDQVSARLRSAGLVFAQVQSVAEVTRDPQALAAGCYTTIGEGDAAVTIPATPIDFGVPLAPVARAPTLDADGPAIRAELTR